jgi:hypothetical protein
MLALVWAYKSCTWISNHHIFFIIYVHMLIKLEPVERWRFVWRPPPPTHTRARAVFLTYFPWKGKWGLWDHINPVLSSIPKWRTFKLLRWMQNLHQSTWELEILCTDRSSKDEQLLMRPFLSKTKKYEHGGQLNVKIHSLFCGDNSWTFALRQMNFSFVRDHGHTYKFYLNNYFVWRSF